MSAPARVLLCDDSVELLELLADRLASHPGLEVVGATRDAASAVRLAAETEPEIVLLDLLMPGAEPEELVLAVAAAAPGAAIVSYSGRPAASLGEGARSLLAAHVEKTTPIAAIAERLATLRGG